MHHKTPTRRLRKSRPAAPRSHRRSASRNWPGSTSGAATSEAAVPDAVVCPPPPRPGRSAQSMGGGTHDHSAGWAAATQPCLQKLPCRFPVATGALISDHGERHRCGATKLTGWNRARSNQQLADPQLLSALRLPHAHLPDPPKVRGFTVPVRQCPRLHNSTFSNCAQLCICTSCLRDLRKVPKRRCTAPMSLRHRAHQCRSCRSLAFTHQMPPSRE